MYKSLKINLHLTQIVYLQIDFRKKKLSKNHFFFYKRKKLDQFKEFILTNKILKFFVVESRNFGANFLKSHWRPKSYLKTTELNFHL